MRIVLAQLFPPITWPRTPYCKQTADALGVIDIHVFWRFKQFKTLGIRIFQYFGNFLSWLRILYLFETHFQADIYECSELTPGKRLTLPGRLQQQMHARTAGGYWRHELAIVTNLSYSSIAPKIFVLIYVDMKQNIQPIAIQENAWMWIKSNYICF